MQKGPISLFGQIFIICRTIVSSYVGNCDRKLFPYFFHHLPKCLKLNRLSTLSAILNELVHGQSHVTGPVQHQRLFCPLKFAGFHNHLPLPRTELI